MNNKRPLYRRAWPKAGKEIAAKGISVKNKLNEVPLNERSFADVRAVPLKRKYLVFRSYMQAPVGSPAQTAKYKGRSHFPMSRNRAIPSSLADPRR